MTADRCGQLAGVTPERAAVARAVAPARHDLAGATVLVPPDKAVCGWGQLSR